MRKIEFTSQAFIDFLKWSEKDKFIFIKISDLILDISRTPFSGLGKPEPLKNNLKGFWSRRINSEHRLVYKVTNETIQILSCKYHY